MPCCVRTFVSSVRETPVSNSTAGAGAAGAFAAEEGRTSTHARTHAAGMKLRIAISRSARKVAAKMGDAPANCN